jgi:hypothetical protein
MIARIWKGAVRRSDGDAYSRYRDLGASHWTMDAQVLPGDR